MKEELGSLHEIIGSWKLISHALHKNTGETIPTSQFLRGRLIYSLDGAMSVFIALREQVQELNDIIAYSGRFTVEAATVLHHVELCANSKRNGTIEERGFSYTEPRLTLTAKTSEGKFIIIWEKEEFGVTDGA